MMMCARRVHWLVLLALMTGCDSDLYVDTKACRDLNASTPCEGEILPSSDDACAARFGKAKAVEDAKAAVQRSDLRLFKTVREAVVVTIEAPGISAAGCPNPTRLDVENDAISRLLNEADFQEDDQPTECQKAAQTYAARYNVTIVQLRPMVLSRFCGSEE